MSTNQSSTVYKNIPNYPGYRVGDDGTIWSRRTRHGDLKAVWHRLKPLRVSPLGYFAVTLYPGARSCLIHRLVLKLFVGPCPLGMQARHLDWQCSEQLSGKSVLGHSSGEWSGQG